MSFKALNLRTGRELADNVATAESVFDRMKGLIGKKGLEKGAALLIRPCRAVHTLGMRFPIDVLFLDSGVRVVGIRENMPPMRLSGFFLKAEAVLELPAGTVSSTGTMIGDVIAIRQPSTTAGA